MVPRDPTRPSRTRPKDTIAHINAGALTSPAGPEQKLEGGREGMNGERGSLTFSGGGRSRRDLMLPLMLKDRDMAPRRASPGAGGVRGGRRAAVVGDRSRRVGK